MPGIKAAILVNIEKDKRKITIAKIVPVLRDNRTRSGLQPYPEVTARVVIRSIEGTPEGTVPQAYELDAKFDQAITLAFSDVTDEAPPVAGPQDFVWGAVFLRKWALTVLSI